MMTDMMTDGMTDMMTDAYITGDQLNKKLAFEVLKLGKCVFFNFVETVIRILN